MNPTTHRCITTGPGVVEVCDGVDNNLDHSVDEGCDDDDDNYCDKSMTLDGASPTCTSGGNDCNDANAAIKPGATEVCDGVDNNCDGTIDGVTRSCGVGKCAGGTETCTNGVWGSCSTLYNWEYENTAARCTDSIDNDCDGSTDCADSDCLTACGTQQKTLDSIYSSDPYNDTILRIINTSGTFDFLRTSHSFGEESIWGGGPETNIWYKQSRLFAKFNLTNYKNYEITTAELWIWAGGDYSYDSLNGAEGTPLLEEISDVGSLDIGDWGIGVLTYSGVQFDALSSSSTYSIYRKDVTTAVKNRLSTGFVFFRFRSDTEDQDRFGTLYGNAYPRLTLTYKIPDSSPPTGTLTLNSGATYATSTSVTLTNTCSDASGCAQMQFSNDGSTYFAAETYAASKSWTLSSGDGTKTVYAKFKDAAGNWMITATTDTIVLDTIAPSSQILTGTTYSQSFSVSVTDEDATSGLASCEYRVFSAGTLTKGYTSRPCGGSFTVTVGFDITNDCHDAGTDTCEVHVRATDNAGNVGPETTHYYSIITDSTAPTTTATYNPAAPNGLNNWYTTNVGVTLTCADNAGGSGCQQIYACTGGSACTLAATGQATAYSTTLSTEGTSYVRYYSKDAAGNTEGTKPSSAFNIDKTAPTSTITAPAASSWQIQSFTPTVTDSDTGGSGLGSGVFYYSVYDTGVGSYTVASGTTRPGGANTIPQITVGAAQNCRAQGTNTCRIYIQATDTAGNTGSATYYVNYSVDYTPPTNPAVSSTSHTANVWSNNKTVNMSFPGATDTGSGVAGYYYLWSTSDVITNIDATTAVGPTGGWTTSTSLTSTTTPATPQLADGTWYFYLRTKDNAGNLASSTLRTGPYKIDTAAPGAPTVSSATHPIQANWHNNNDPGLSWNVPETETSSSSGTDGFSYALDQSASTIPGTTKTAEETTTSIFYTDTADGIWYFHIRAKDNAGNWGTLTTHYTLRIDTTPPSISLTSPTGNPYLSGSVTITGTASDANPSTISTNDTHFTVNSGSYSSWSFASTTPLGDGQYVVNITASDLAGNKNSVIATFKADNTPPGISISSAPWPLPHVNWTNKTQTASMICTDTPAGGVTSGCDSATYRFLILTAAGACSTSYASYTLVPPQTILTHNWVCAAAKDTAGNIGFTALPTEFKVDMDNPTISITAPSKPHANVSGIQTVSVSASDPTSGVSVIEFYLEKWTGTGFVNMNITNCAAEAGADNLFAKAAPKAAPGTTTASRDLNTSKITECATKGAMGGGDGLYRIVVVAYDMDGQDAYPGGFNLAEDYVNITVDNTPPVTTLTIEGTKGKGDWYVSGVSVTVSCSDVTTACKLTKFRVKKDATFTCSDAAGIKSWTGKTSFNCDPSSGVATTSGNSAFFRITAEGRYMIETQALDTTDNSESWHTSGAGGG